MEAIESVLAWFAFLKSGLGVVLVVLGVVVTLVTIRMAFIFIVGPKEVGVILRRGKIRKHGLSSGWYLTIPFIDSCKSEFMGIRRVEVEEETRTKDNNIVTVECKGHYFMIESKVLDVMFGIEGKPEDLVKDLLLSALRSAVSGQTASQCFEHKDEISQSVKSQVTEALTKIGFELIDILITKIDPHKDVVASINRVQEAIRETEAETARAGGVKTRLTAEAEGQRAAAALRGKGTAEMLASEAEGYLNMLRIMTGNQQLVLEPKNAVGFVLYMRNLAMKQAFALSGKASALVLPDDSKMIEEIAQLVPALMSHAQVDGDGEDDDATVEQLTAEFRSQMAADFKEQGESFLAQLEAAGADIAEETISSLPKSLQGIARRAAKKLGRKLG